MCKPASYRQRACVSARTLPCSSTASGMTLLAPGPVLKRVMEMTAESVGDVSRDTNGCSASTCATAAFHTEVNLESNLEIFKSTDSKVRSTDQVRPKFHKCINEH